MIREYFISLYFYILKKRLHKMRLNFFMELNELESLIKTKDFGYTMGGFLENILHSFTRIISLVNKIEGIEKYMGKGDIFDSNFYIIQIHRDMLDIIAPIDNQLKNKLMELRSLEIQSLSRSENINLQNNRIVILISNIENATEKMKYIIEQLNNTIVRYATTRI